MTGPHVLELAMHIYVCNVGIVTEGNESEMYMNIGYLTLSI